MNKTLTKEEAQQEVQRLLTEAERLLEAAGRIMDEHQFTARFQDRDYFPRGVKTKPYCEDEDYCDLVRPLSQELGQFVINKYKLEDLMGTWVSSSQWSEC